MFLRRVGKELALLSSESIDGISLIEEDLPDKILVKVKTASDSVYQGETYTLSLRVTNSYPFVAPVVQFIKSPIPVHPHIYSNGHICLSILDTDWTPAMSISSVCISILSMLNSCKLKTLPEDNDSYVRHCPSDPSKTSWYFHVLFFVFVMFFNCLQKPSDVRNLTWKYQDDKNTIISGTFQLLMYGRFLSLETYCRKLLHYKLRKRP